jgi:molybdopterin synthase catalytic subunit
VDAGALAVFGGTVRAVDRDARIAALDYDVHLAMADRAIRRIERTCSSRRDGVLACRIVHRVGRVQAGEPSVYVVVRARHRPEAFEAARDGIDRVKAEAPIWKEDVHPDGTQVSPGEFGGYAAHSRRGPKGRFGRVPGCDVPLAWMGFSYHLDGRLWRRRGADGGPHAGASWRLTSGKPAG